MATTKKVQQRFPAHSEWKAIKSANKISVCIERAKDLWRLK